MLQDDDVLYPADGQPLSAEAHKQVLSWTQDSFTAADNARRQYEDRWIRWYKHYRSYVKRRDKADWRSRVFMPVVFFVIETITPKLVAQLPEFLVRPRTRAGAEPIVPDGPSPAEVMQTTLNWSADESRLFEPEVAGFKDALIFGTGILKVFHKEDVRNLRVSEPQPLQMQVEMPVLNPEDGMPLVGMDGEITESRTIEIADQGPAIQQVRPVTIYDGPAAECIDLFNFWVAPEAESVQGARYVIQRTFRDMDYVRELVKAKIYQLPEGRDIETWARTDDEPHARRLREIGIDVARDPRRRVVEVMEFWTKDRLITVLNRNMVVRVQTNPFDHGMKPYVRIVDHLVPHEFYGIGEVEPIEGLQDLTNAMTNSLIDNVKLVMNMMFMVNTDHVRDLRDLVVRPGGIIRVQEMGLPVNQAVQRLDMGEIPVSGFTELEMLQSIVDRTTGVSGYQTGTNAPSMNDTATGVNIITEQGNTRFGLKMTLNENMGLRELATMFGSILQQFLPASLEIAVADDAGGQVFQSIRQEDILGEFNYDIEPQSTSVTESMRKEQSMTLLQVAQNIVDPTTGAPVANVSKLFDDVLKAFGIKNRMSYHFQPPAPTTGLGSLAGPMPPPPGAPPAISIRGNEPIPILPGQVA